MPRTTTGDRRAASSQLRTVDQSARVNKETRAVEQGDEITVPLKGKDGEIFEARLADEVGIMALMEWVAAADGKNKENSKSLVAVYHVLEDTVHPDDWEEFRAFGREHKIQAQGYGEFINAALEAAAGRPTEESTGS